MSEPLPGRSDSEQRLVPIAAVLGAFGALILGIALATARAPASAEHSQSSLPRTLAADQQSSRGSDTLSVATPTIVSGSDVEGAFPDERVSDARPEFTLERISSAELEQLAQNPDRKLLLVNFWATWCLPCRTEFPELVALHREYSAQELEFVAVSVDGQEDRPAVQAFLREMKSSARNLQVQSDDLFAVRRAFGHGWNAGVPFTVLLDPAAGYTAE